jgi:hypothetical protein
MTPQVSNTNEVPGLPVSEVRLNPFDISIDREYALHYRHGNNPNCQKNFQFKGTFREAMARARTHCDKMGYRFILLRPAISDLESDEKNRENGISI